MAGHDRATLHAALENNVMIAPGDGLWGTIDRLGDYALRFADEREGQVGHFGTENGVQTTDNPEFAYIVPVAALGCEARFRMGNYRYDDRLRGRRFPLADEPRGLVLAFGFIRRPHGPVPRAPPAQLLSRPSPWDGQAAPVLRPRHNRNPPRGGGKMGVVTIVMSNYKRSPNRAKPVAAGRFEPG